MLDHLNVEVFLGIRRRTLKKRTQRLSYFKLMNGNNSTTYIII